MSRSCGDVGEAARGDDYEATTAWNFLVIITMDLYFMNEYNLNLFIFHFHTQ